MSAGHLLVVDDDQAILDLLTDFLSEHGFTVATATDGRTMGQALDARPSDLVILDVKLPGEDGLSLAARLRATADIPIIMLTGQGGDIDRIVGLELGADDYVVKPFNPRELLARIKAVLRRSRGTDAPRAEGERPDRRRFRGWEVDLSTRVLTAPDGRPVSLTQGEFNLLEALVRAPNRILSRDQLLTMTRLTDGDVFDRTIDVLILRLRRKIEPNPKTPSLIRTERGLGYVFAADVVTV